MIIKDDSDGQTYELTHTEISDALEERLFLTIWFRYAATGNYTTVITNGMRDVICSGEGKSLTQATSTALSKFKELKPGEWKPLHHRLLVHAKERKRRLEDG